MLTNREVQEERRYAYVPPTNSFMLIALSRVAEMQHAHPEVNHPTCSALIKGGKIVAVETGRQVHRTFCPRIALGSPSGEDYEYCPDHCHPDNHSEANAIGLARENGIDLRGAELYLGGHWWACGSCWEKIERAGIARVYLAGDAKAKYNDDARRADTERARAGVMRTPLTVYLAGNPESVRAFSGYLARVGITSFSGDEERIAEADALILLPRSQGSDTFWEKWVPVLQEMGCLFDYRAEEDLRHALTRLSQELP